uniref:GP-PDE domain-containing protein n=1 Tax=viral metagenome TaxID=1070528 RepID=A0A6C0JIK9_9ZZZZ
MNVICHRIDYYSQNNINLIDSYIKKGINSFEIDIQLCKDEIVIFHDFSLTSKGINKNVSEFPLEQLEKYGIYSIDKLFSLLTNYSKVNIFLDLKGFNEKLIGKLYEKLINIDLSKNTFYIQSFNHYFINLLKKLLGNNIKNIFFGYLIGTYMDIHWHKYIKNIDYLCIDNQFISKFIKKIEKPLYVYNCNSKEELTCESRFLSGIITDFPFNFKRN